MKIVQAKDDNDEVDQVLGNEVYSNQRTKMTSTVYVNSNFTTASE